MAFTTMHDFHYEMMRSSIQNFDLETIKYLTGIGPENLFDIETTTISEEELKLYTKLYKEKNDTYNYKENS